MDEVVLVGCWKKTKGEIQGSQNNDKGC